MDYGTSRSWFVIYDNPEKYGDTGTPQEIVDGLMNKWVDGHPARSGAWIYCVSSKGLKHVHMVVEDVQPIRFKAVQKVYSHAHLEATKGNKDQAEDYINKRGKWSESGEKILATARYGEIKGVQGQRRDLDVIEELIHMGMSARDILNMSFRYRRYEKMIRDACVARDFEKADFIRDVKVVWHVGQAGSGKSYTAKILIDQYGSDNVYFMSDYEVGGFDNYMCEKILFLDEFRGQWRYSYLLSILDKYKRFVHARYSNVPALWNEIHITSVKTPDMIYKSQISVDEQMIDTFDQLRRRIHSIVYHWRDLNGGYHAYVMPMSEYKSYDDLVVQALRSGDFVQLPLDLEVPFD